MILNENGAIAYSTSNNSLVDLFYSSVRGMTEYTLSPLFLKSIMNFPDETLQLIFYTRDCRNGKGERDLSYLMMKLLYQYNPIIYKKYLIEFVEKYGRFEDYIHLDKIRNKGEGAGEEAGEGEGAGEGADKIELLHFIEKLKIDQWNLQQGNTNISLAAKWAPSEKSCFSDAHKYMAKKMFGPKKGYKLYRQTISSLRTYLNIVERNMSLDNWDSIEFSKVPAQAMRIYGKNIMAKTRDIGAFHRHLPEQFGEYLKNVSTGKEKINATGIQPHQLVHGYNGLISDPVIEEQWTKLITELKNSGSSTGLKNSCAIVDVSGSMAGTPIDVAIALGLIVAELTDNTIITFSETPEFFHITGKTLLDKINNIRGMKWGYNTNFISAMNLVLQKAIITGICPSTMFVFSDMQFDQASGTNKLNFTQTKEMFEKRGLSMPKIVFWNLRANTSGLPCTTDSNGSVLVSGFNTTILKLFMENTSYNPFQLIKELLLPYKHITFCI